jgi:hypothetical protein
MRIFRPALKMVAYAAIISVITSQIPQKFDIGLAAGSSFSFQTPPSLELNYTSAVDLSAQMAATAIPLNLLNSTLDHHKLFKEILANATIPGFDPTTVNLVRDVGLLNITYQIFNSSVFNPLSQELQAMTDEVKQALVLYYMFSGINGTTNYDSFLASGKGFAEYQTFINDFKAINISQLILDGTRSPFVSFEGLSARDFSVRDLLRSLIIPPLVRSGEQPTNSSFVLDKLKADLDFANFTDNIFGNLSMKKVLSTLVNLTDVERHQVVKLRRNLIRVVELPTESIDYTKFNTLSDPFQICMNNNMSSVQTLLAKELVSFFATFFPINSYILRNKLNDISNDFASFEPSSLISIIGKFNTSLWSIEGFKKILFPCLVPVVDQNNTHLPKFINFDWKEFALNVNASLGQLGAPREPLPKSLAKYVVMSLFFVPTDGTVLLNVTRDSIVENSQSLAGQILSDTDFQLFNGLFLNLTTQDIVDIIRGESGSYSKELYLTEREFRDLLDVLPVNVNDLANKTESNDFNCSHVPRNYDLQLHARTVLSSSDYNNYEALYFNAAQIAAVNTALSANVDFMKIFNKCYGGNLDDFIPTLYTCYPNERDLLDENPFFNLTTLQSNYSLSSMAALSVSEVDALPSLNVSLPMCLCKFFDHHFPRKLNKTDIEALQLQQHSRPCERYDHCLYLQHDNKSYYGRCDRLPGKDVPRPEDDLQLFRQHWSSGLG